MHEHTLDETELDSQTTPTQGGAGDDGGSSSSVDAPLNELTAASVRHYLASASRGFRIFGSIGVNDRPAQGAIEGLVATVRAAGGAAITETQNNQNNQNRCVHSVSVGLKRAERSEQCCCPGRR